MIWSLVKILLFVAITAFLAYMGGRLLETDGQLQIIVLGYEVTLGPLQTVILAVLLVFAIWGLMRLSGLIIAVLRFINGDETAISRYFDRNRERRGFEALADGMMALASGEGRLAMAKAARAEKFLARPELTNLLAAQAAEMAGDRDKAEEVYKRLLKDDRTRFVGVRGILKQKLAEGDTDTALALAERAFSLKPRHEDTSDILLRLQAQKQDWAGARRTLGSKVRTGNLPRDVHRRRDAVLALSQAQDTSDAEDPKLREYTLEANRLSPDLAPAAAAAASILAKEGRQKQAVKVIKKAWEAAPHPELAAAFAAIYPDESHDERTAQFQALFALHPEDDETKIVQTELAIAAGNYELARDSIEPLEASSSTARVLALRAAIERGSGAEDSVVRDYLTQALDAPRGPAWVCENCNSVAPQWSPVCTNCDGLDTLAWKQIEADSTHASDPLPASMIEPPEATNKQ